MNPVPDPFNATTVGNALHLLALGNLVAGTVAAQRVFLGEHLDRAKHAVVLDLGGAELVDSLGITLVVGLYKSCQERKLDFSVEGVNAEVMRLFKFFSLNDVFQIRGR